MFFFVVALCFVGMDIPFVARSYIASSALGILAVNSHYFLRPLIFFPSRFPRLQVLAEDLSENKSFSDRARKQVVLDVQKHVERDPVLDLVMQRSRNLVCTVAMVMDRPDRFCYFIVINKCN